MAEAKAFSNLQTLNLALATGFIVTCGDAVQAISDVWGRQGGTGFANVGLLILLVSIGAKVAFDDHAALGEGKIRPFQVVDSTALVVTYSIIISATALIVHFYLSSLLLAFYILALGLWNLGGYLLLCFGAKPAREIREFREASGMVKVRIWFQCLHADDAANRLLIQWLTLDLSFGGLLVLFSLGQVAPLMVLIAVAAFLAVDLLLSEAFGK